MSRVYSVTTNQTTDYSKKSTAQKYSNGLIDSHSEKLQALKALGNLNDKCILDVGCGDGVFSEMLLSKGSNVIGIGPSQEFIQTAKHNNSNKTPDQLKFDNINAVNLSDNFSPCFDMIVMLNLLPNVSDEQTLKDVFNNCAAVIKEKGVILFTSVNPESVHQGFQGDVRRMHLPSNTQNKTLFPGYKYQAEYLLTNGDWIKFTDSYWSDEHIRHSLSAAGFTKIKSFPHVPKKGEVPDNLLKCYTEMPIRNFYRCEV